MASKTRGGDPAEYKEYTEQSRAYMQGTSGAGYTAGLWIRYGETGDR